MEALREQLLARMGLLRKLADSLALLDMLCSLAAAAQDGGEGYARPQCTREGPIAIVKGRHPLLEQRCGVEFKPNDTYLSDCSSMHVIMGPNMSGKSTYIRQVRLPHCVVSFLTACLP